MKYGDTCDTIPIKTIQTRFRSNTMSVSHRGTKSPMSYLEPVLLQIVIQRGKMNQPLTVTEGLQLANSMIKVGSVTEKSIISYLKTRNQYSTDGSATKIPGNMLGTGYWKGFLPRYAHELVSNSDIIVPNGVNIPILRECTTLFMRK